MSTFGVLLLAINKHEVAGIAVLVVGVIIALYGVFRVVQRLSGAALVLAAGVVVAVVGALVYTRTIHP